MMIRRWHSGLLFPLVLAVCLGGLSTWLSHISELKVEEVILNPNEPQYAMSGIEGKQFDQEGRLKDNLSAQKAWQLPKSDKVYFAQPQLALYKNGELLYNVKSDEARYNLDNHQILFEQNVELSKQGVDGQPSGVLQTSRLTVDTDKQTAHTDSSVVYNYGQSHGTANGLNYDHKKGLLNLPSRVKAIIYDPKNH